MTERLRIDFTYDHAAGVFTAHLENGASFIFDRAAVNGKLENCLTLFARQVVAMNGGKWAKPVEVKDRSRDYSYDESKIKRYTPSGKRILPELDLSDLNLDL